MAGYYPDDPIEALIVDEITDSTNELMWKMPRDNDEEVKKKQREQWQASQLTQCANLIESRIQSAGGKSVLSTPSVADIAVHWLVLCIRSGFLDYIDTAFFNGYPGILATSEGISDDPKFKAYYASLKPAGTGEKCLLGTMSLACTTNRSNNIVLLHPYDPELTMKSVFTCSEVCLES